MPPVLPSVSLGGARSEFEDGTWPYGEIWAEPGVLNVVCLPFEPLLFDSPVRDVVPFERRAESAMRVGDAIDRSVLFDAPGGALPRDPLLRIVGYGSEAVGEIAGRILGGGVAAGVDVETDRQT